VANPIFAAVHLALHLNFRRGDKERGVKLRFLGKSKESAIHDGDDFAQFVTEEKQKDEGLLWWSPESLASNELMVREYMNGYNAGDSFAWAPSGELVKKEKEHARLRRREFFRIAREFSSMRLPASSWFRITRTSQDLDPFNDDG